MDTNSESPKSSTSDLSGSTSPDIASQNDFYDVPTETPQFRNWQRIMLALMVVGYAGYYLCRVHLSVCTPQIIEQFKAQGVNKSYIGHFVSLGTLAYAFGKFISGSLADFIGGKRMFLAGMLGAILCTLLFGAGGLPLFTMAWALNRLIQSAGWAGLVKMTSRWFSFSSYGTAMGIISLSYLFGDFLSRLFLGNLIKGGMAWQQVFYTAAAILSVVFLISIFLLKESPKDVGEPEPAANPANLFSEPQIVEEGGQEEPPSEPTSLLGLLWPLLRNSTFWVVCVLSFGFTLVRETFGTWTPQYLTEVAHMAKGDAAQASSLFPLFGGISVLLVGYLSDKIGKMGRALIILVGLLLAIPALLAMGHLPTGGTQLIPILMLALVAFLLIGPYSFLAGAISLDLGGKKGSATAAGWIDGIGYLGGVFAGEGIGKIAEKSGWVAAFDLLALIAGLSAVAAAVYCWNINRKSTN